MNRPRHEFLKKQSANFLFVLTANRTIEGTVVTYLRLVLSISIVEDSRTEQSERGQWLMFRTSSSSASLPTQASLSDSPIHPGSSTR